MDGVYGFDDLGDLSLEFLDSELAFLAANGLLFELFAAFFLGLDLLLPEELLFAEFLRLLELDFREFFVRGFRGRLFDGDANFFSCVGIGFFNEDFLCVFSN